MESIICLLEGCLKNIKIFHVCSVHKFIKENFCLLFVSQMIIWFYLIQIRSNIYVKKRKQLFFQIYWKDI